MTGYVGIEIAVKPYIKAYLHKELGDTLKLAPGAHVIYNQLLSLLERNTNPDKADADCNYGAFIKVYISVSKMKRFGCNLNSTNIRQFNKFVELLLKHRFHRMMDDLISMNPGFERNLRIVRRQLGIDEDDWSTDSMKKDYYRSRVKRNMPLLRRKDVD